MKSNFIATIFDGEDNLGDYIFFNLPQRKDIITINEINYEVKHLNYVFNYSNGVSYVCKKINIMVDK